MILIMVCSILKLISFISYQIIMYLLKVTEMLEDNTFNYLYRQVLFLRRMRFAFL